MRTFVKSVDNLVKAIAPKNLSGDFFVSFIHFLWTQKRLPGNPDLFNDYIFFQKLGRSGMDPIRQYICDKYFVKQFICAKLGSNFCIPTLALLHNDKDIDNYCFPDYSCIKPTHASGKFMFKRQGNFINRTEVKQWLRINHYQKGRESCYRWLVPKIIVEPLVFNNNQLIDYKIFCFKGEPKIIQVDFDSRTNHKRCFFDTSWNRLPFSLTYPTPAITPAQPKTLTLMLSAASALSEDFSFIRVDMYTDNCDVIIGELTNWPANAGGRFNPRDSEYDFSKILFNKI